MDDLNDKSEEDVRKLGYLAVSDGMSIIDFEDNSIDDIQQMYGILKPEYPDDAANLEDFYSDHNAFDDPEALLKGLLKFKDREQLNSSPAGKHKKESTRAKSNKNRKENLPKLLHGYSMETWEYSDNSVQYRLYRDHVDGKEFTGLIAACADIVEAIEVFNAHIPILEGAVLDEPLVISIRK